MQRNRLKHSKKLMKTIVTLAKNAKCRLILANDGNVKADCIVLA